MVSGFIHVLVPKGPTAIESALQSDLVGIYNPSATGKAKSNARNSNGTITYDRFRDVMAGGLPLDIIGEGQNEFRAIPFLQTPLQGVQIQIFGPHPSHGGKLSVKHVVEPSECSRVLDGDKVGNMFDQANSRTIPPLVQADAATFLLGQISTPTAPLDPRSGADERIL